MGLICSKNKIFHYALFCNFMQLSFNKTFMVSLLLAVH